MLTQRFEQAFVYASSAHGGQLKKGTNVPYLAHVMDVTALVLMNGGDEDQAIGGLFNRKKAGLDDAVRELETLASSPPA